MMKAQSVEPAGPLPGWRFESIDTVSQAGKSTNEDRATASTGAAWILDGATGLTPQRLFPGPRDPAWLAATADELLGRLAREIDDGMTLPHRFVAEPHQACAATALASLGDTDIELPSASLTVAHLIGAEIELVTLGDCKLLLRQQDGRAEAFDQSSVALFDAKVVDALRSIQAGSETELRKITPKLTALIRENRLWKNRPGGYGVLMADPTCLAFAEATRRPAAGATHLRLATDD